MLSNERICVLLLTATELRAEVVLKTLVVTAFTVAFADPRTLPVTVSSVRVVEVSKTLVTESSAPVVDPRTLLVNPFTAPVAPPSKSLVNVPTVPVVAPSTPPTGFVVVPVVEVNTSPTTPFTEVVRPPSVGNTLAVAPVMPVTGECGPVPTTPNAVVGAANGLPGTMVTFVPPPITRFVGARSFVASWPCCTSIAS